MQAAKQVTELVLIVAIVLIAAEVEVIPSLITLLTQWVMFRRTTEEPNDILSTKEE